ncbi:Unknown protein sequence [Pseudomonas amygdali pv. sesami]|nr:Unknown protein sequence [Pseudomonas amygdali pv. sesami]
MHIENMEARQWFIGRRGRVGHLPDHLAQLVGFTDSTHPDQQRVPVNGLVCVEANLYLFLRFQLRGIETPGNSHRSPLG